MDAVIFLGTRKSGSSREALKAANQKGFYTCLLTENVRQIQDRYEYPEVHSMILTDLNNIDAIRTNIKELQKQFNICSIISFIDPYCAIAAELAEEYGVGKFTYSAMYKMQNKLKCREVMNGTDFNPKYEIITKESYQNHQLKINYPLVVKYIESTGSKDVYFCKDDNAYKKYVNKIFSIYPNGNILIEEYIDGPQYLIEALVINNHTYIIAVINQEISFHNDHFIVTGYNLLTNYPKTFYLQLKMDVSTIISKHKLENGPCHLEMRLVNNQWKLIEINPRISGAGMNDLLKIGLGIDLVNETLNLALKGQVRIKPKYLQNTFAEYVVLEKPGILDRITGKNKVMNMPGVRYVYVKPKKGCYLATPESLGNRYAFVIAIGESEEKAKENAKTAAANIIFHIYENK